MKLKDIMLISLALVIYARDDDTNKTTTSIQASNKMYAVTSSLLKRRFTSSTPGVGGQQQTVLSKNSNFSNSKQLPDNLGSEEGDNKTQSKQSSQNLESDDGDNKPESKQSPQNLESDDGDNKPESKQSPELLESHEEDNKTQPKQVAENLKSNSNEHSRQIWRPLNQGFDTGDNKSSFITGKPPTEEGTLLALNIMANYSNQKPNYELCEDQEVFNPPTCECTRLIYLPWEFPMQHQSSVSNSVFNMAKSSQVLTTAWQTLIMLVTTTSDMEDGCSQFVVYVSQSYQSSMNESDESQMSANQSLDTASLKLPMITCQPSDFGNKETALRNYTLSLHFNKITVNFTKTLKILVELMLNFDENVSEIVITNIHNLTQDINMRNSCNPIGKTEFILSDHEDNVFIVVNFPKIKICYPLTTNGYKLEVVVDASQKQSLRYEEKVILCAVRDLFFRSNCRISSFNLNETSQIGSVLKIMTIEQYFGEDDYEVLGDKVFVCIKSSNTAKNVTYLLISFIFSSISIICLALMLIVHYLFQELRSLSGKMNTSLAWKALFIVVLNLLSLLDLSHRYVCPVLAVFTHVITLAHFGWMSAIAVHMTLTFCHRSGTLIKSTSDEQMFIRYNIIVWGLSIVIVTPCVVLDFTHPDEDLTSGSGIDTKDRALNTSMVSLLNLAESSVYPRYGFPFCTWFSGAMWARLAFIIVPYFVSYTVSLGGFVFTLVGLHGLSENPETISKRSFDKTQCIIYITLTTEMDFALISYTLASLYPDVDILVYVYTWLVLLQGVFLFVAFTMNKTVLSLIRKFCGARG